MWKYVAFVLLIIFSAPAVLGDEGVVNSASNESFTTDNSTLAEISTPVADPSTNSTNETTVHTTVEPPTPTTPAPTTPESTTSKVTTVPPAVTTVLPPPDVGKYSVHETDENKTCLRIDMALRVSFHDVQSSYNFPANASTEGSSCNDSNTQVLKLTAQDNKHTLTLIFVQEDKKNYAKDIKFSYYTSEMKTVNKSGTFFRANEGNFFLCHSAEEVEMENVTLTFSSVRVQAFGADEFGRAEECSADDKVGDIVPIAVGCALGALVIIVLIAYLVGRRRSHQKGYQSV